MGASGRPTAVDAEAEKDAAQAAEPPPGPGGGAAESPAEPARSPPVAVRELADGETVYLEEVGATVTAAFITPYGREIVSFTVAPDDAGKGLQVRPAAGPTTLDFRWDEDHLFVHVLSIDRTARTVRVRTAR